ncbi:MAG: GYF domain-containing protein, partial [Planctomycetota bacterium]
MKIVCDSCSAKYSIADEKVQGKVFKIRCKKCSNVIVVKGTGDADGEGLGGGAGAAEWYIVIEGEQVGPVTATEIESYFASGQVDAETYAWKDGMGDWMHLAAIEEFAGIAAGTAGPNEQTTIAESSKFDPGDADSTNVVSSPLSMGEGGAAEDAAAGGYD